MRRKKNIVVGVERRVQQFFYARDINLAVLNEGMVAVNQDGSHRDKKEKDDRLEISACKRF
jgi:hypothetical protein